jgi:DNA modification methylase
MTAAYYSDDLVTLLHGDAPQQARTLPDGSVQTIVTSPPYFGLRDYGEERHFAVYPPELIRPCILAGARPGDTVLDPFSGSGTTGMVATQEGRKYIGIDLNSDYLDLSLKTRFAQPVLNFGAEQAQS